MTSGVLHSIDEFVSAIQDRVQQLAGTHVTTLCVACEIAPGGRKNESADCPYTVSFRLPGRIGTPSRGFVCQNTYDTDGKPYDERALTREHLGILGSYIAQRDPHLSFALNAQCPCLSIQVPQRSAVHRDAPVSVEKGKDLFAAMRAAVAE